MPASWRREVYDEVENVVLGRDGEHVESEEPMATINRILRRSPLNEPGSTDMAYDSDSDDESDHDHAFVTTTMLAPATTPTPSLALPLPFLVTMTVTGIRPVQTALADSDPTETVVVTMPPPRQQSSNGISQTTEHLLIAAGSIGATIIIVMLVLAIYTMRKRGLTIKDLLSSGRQQMHRGSPPSHTSTYGQDTKRPYDDEYTYGMRDNVNAPQPAAISRRSGPMSSQKPLQDLERSDSFNQPPTRDGNRSFYDDTVSRSDGHRRNISETPSSPVLPIEGRRQSASTRNTRSMDGDESTLDFPDLPQRPPSNLPAPPTFRQFLSNRPSISQRPGFGGAAAGGIASRFSWTNSQAPQTPHDPSRDTAVQSVGRDSYMTSRSSVPRFRTVDSWVNQQSNRVEEQRLKQQFRMTQSTTYSEDEVPDMPALPPATPKNASGITRTPSGKNGLVGRDIKHQRHDTRDTQTTAPVFKAHPGTEVRFSTRSAVPSEVLDMGRKNTAL
ncbi:hypothetical protein PtrSN002B_002006 [Pyrenophora tritici-repentis]|uniref:Uncharacterized protein n=2 Tax=Pyrenophora tritici-repentis TaxID=45151 RepID=A0A2W1H760_9PLEO|nr:uncharacterized protein PTRG_05937 [Pyrenophora tritici-repentis Pt-1C-BFP]KAA8619058.1 hypothetical protein PtrV1_08487 [Pyrenophora tritici-repentis]EDU48857.1 predicted protein [Pyrenophora tritici-repentis Pt-1C-BFP]KAF7449522.1 hypothetical protein A1F99_065710 [Pyrenophora tritici-repentis]KAF7570364.1 hypothetical protein PtrM4_103660 [Pyrenophora tritici-repentis]KAG9383535.1 hypothetical protein A1F94_005446 [Pyrenophora tritici-repentis]